MVDDDHTLGVEDQTFPHRVGVGHAGLLVQHGRPAEVGAAVIVVDIGELLLIIRLFGRKHIGKGTRIEIRAFIAEQHRFFRPRRARAEREQHRRGKQKHDGLTNKFHFFTSDTFDQAENALRGAVTRRAESAYRLLYRNSSDLSIPFCDNFVYSSSTRRAAVRLFPPFSSR